MLRASSGAAPRGLQAATVALRCIGETSRGGGVSPMFRDASVIDGAWPCAMGLSRSAQTSVQSAETLSGTCACGVCDIDPACDIHAARESRRSARSRASATHVLNVFVASVARVALAFCLLAPGEMRCYICDGLVRGRVARFGSERRRGIPHRRRVGGAASRGAARIWRRRRGVAVPASSVLEELFAAGTMRWTSCLRPRVPAARNARSTTS